MAAQPINGKAIQEMIEHFKGLPVSNDALLAYCNRRKIEPISEGVYSDYLFQHNHDQRMRAFVPAVLAVLCKIQYVPELASDAERKKLMEANDALEIDICQLMEEHGILYQEIDIVTQTLGSNLQGIVMSAGKRANNMIATMLGFIAKEKYGDPLTVKTLGEAYRAHAAKGE